MMDLSTVVSGGGLISKLEKLEELLRMVALQCLRNHFEDKSMHCGGRIPQTQLLSEKNVSLLVDMDFGLGVDACYAVLANRPSHIITHIFGTPGSKRAPWDIDFMVQKIDELKLEQVPKQFQPGIILIYLRYCLGYKWPSNLLEITKSTREVIEDTFEEEFEEEFEEPVLI